MAMVDGKRTVGFSLADGTNTPLSCQDCHVIIPGKPVARDVLSALTIPIFGVRPSASPTRVDFVRVHFSPQAMVCKLPSSIVRVFRITLIVPLGLARNHFFSASINFIGHEECLLKSNAVNV